LQSATIVLSNLRGLPVFRGIRISFSWSDYAPLVCSGDCILCLRSIKSASPNSTESCTAEAAGFRFPQSPNRRGHTREQSPVFVKEIPASKTQADAEHASKDREEKSANDRHLLLFNGILACVAVLQLLVYGFQSIKLQQTVEAAEGQSAAMEKHIAQATRAAIAMENISDVLQVGNKAITRAYITAVIGAAIPQTRREPGQPDLFFEAKPQLWNNGATPAKKVVTKVAVQIMPVDDIPTFDFPVPEETYKLKGSEIGARQYNIISKNLDHFVSDSEVSSIKEGTKTVFCVWGLVPYEDVFGDPHYRQFGQALTSWPDGTVYGYYIDGQNHSD
jgi:hypothetical protein